MPELSLFALTVATRRGASLQLLYRDRENARTAYAALNPPALFDRRGLEDAPPPRVEVTDDYGVQAAFTLDDLSMVWFSDLEAESEGRRRLAMFQARANAQLNREAAADSSLKTVLAGGTLPILGKRQ